MSDGFQGKLLIALPGIGDERFDRSVILVCAHEADYAMGIVLNKPMTGLTVPDLLAQLNIPMEIEVPAQTVLDGGPVGNERGFVVHSDDIHCEGATIAVSPAINLTATKDILIAMASAHPPEKAILALGYAGWGPGQLDNEMRENAWLVAPGTADIIYDTPHDQKWNAALGLIGVDSGRLPSGSGHA